ncbi:hypothetical protein GGI07_000252 [Coemansia sp. Benny D115]|nr:hypothetical protein GGI07_000252 [Coemansia sp. Benny D115]
MSSSTILNVAVCGAENPLGALFATEIQKSDNADLKLTILTTTEYATLLSEKFGKSVVSQVDYDDQQSLVAALGNQDILISTIAGNLIPIQHKLIQAAAQTNLKLFVPSNFGPDILAPTNLLFNLFDGSRQVLSALESLSVNHMIVCNGFFTEYYLTKFFNWDLENKTTSVYKDDVKASFTGLNDLIKYTLAAVRRYEEFKNHTLRLSAFTVTPREWIDAVERISGNKVSVTQLPLDDLLQDIKAMDHAPNDLDGIKKQMLAVLATGGGVVDYDGFELDNSKFPDIKPQTLDDFVKASLL